MIYDKYGEKPKINKLLKIYYNKNKYRKWIKNKLLIIIIAVTQQKWIRTFVCCYFSITTTKVSVSMYEGITTHQQRRIVYCNESMQKLCQRNHPTSNNTECYTNLNRIQLKSTNYLVDVRSVCFYQCNQHSLCH
jgi:hypothetical protein